MSQVSWQRRIRARFILNVHSKLASYTSGCTLKLIWKIAVGEIIGEYDYREDLGADMKHSIPVEWKKTDIPS